MIEGEVALESGEVRPAIDSFTLANSILDTWIGHLDLGRAYLKAGNEFLKAETEFGKCNSRRGEAIELFLDDVPTYGYFPPVDYYRGLALEGLNSPEAAKYFRSYLDVRGKGDDHPMLREANRHAGARR